MDSSKKLTLYLRPYSLINLSAIFFWIFIAGIFIFSWKLQAKLFLNCDVSWLVEAAERLLAGKSYTQDFFENNPPLILYLYSIPLKLAAKTWLSINTVFKFYIFVFIAYSLMACNYLSKKILILKEERCLQPMLVTALAFSYLLLPISEFGQREHLFYVGFMPYVFLVIARSNHTNFSPWINATVGFLAAVVVALKPFFLAPLILLEGLYFFERKTLPLKRLEILIFICVIFFYGLSILILHPDYLKTVVPFASKWCYTSVGLPFLMICLNPLFIWIFCVTFLYLFLGSFSTLERYLLLTQVGFILVYFFQQNQFFYHLYPAFSLTFLLFTIFLVRLLTGNNKREILLMIVSLFLICFYLPMHYISYFFYFNPYAFYLLLSISFSLMIYFNYHYTNKVFLNIFTGLIFIVISYHIASLVSFTNFYEHILGILWILLSLCLALLINGNLQKKIKYLFSTYLLFGFMFYPTYIISNYYAYNQLKRSDDVPNLIRLFNQYALHETVYFFSTSYFNQLLMMSEDTKSASRFSSFWMLPGIIKQSYYKNYSNQVLGADSQFLIHMVVDDIKRHKPKLILVDKSLNKRDFQVFKRDKFTFVKKNIPFDYIEFFSKDEQFANEWKKYKYLTTLSHLEIILQWNNANYEVYQRVD